MFTDQNYTTNLNDSNGRAIWALGYLFSISNLLPKQLLIDAERLILNSLPHIKDVSSTRAMAFAIKGLYYYNNSVKSIEVSNLIIQLADRMVQMYKHESSPDWNWFESYLTYANSVMPEAMVYAWLVSNNKTYKEIALSTLEFLLLQTFTENGIEVISNKKWLQKGAVKEPFGEQAIDVAYTIMTLNKFSEVFGLPMYHRKMEIAFSWFLGKNRLHQIIYNPCTGGCYDGLEDTHVNINQGAESTLSYLMARLTMEKYQHL
jgi:hypothetical protein